MNSLRNTKCSRGQKPLQVILFNSQLDIVYHPWLLRHNTFCCRCLHRRLQQGQPCHGTQHQQLHHEWDRGGEEGWDNKESGSYLGRSDAFYSLPSYGYGTPFLCLFGWWGHKMLLLLRGILPNLCIPLHRSYHPCLHHCCYFLGFPSIPSEKKLEKILSVSISWEMLFTVFGTLEEQKWFQIFKNGQNI